MAKEEHLSVPKIDVFYVVFLMGFHDFDSYPTILKQGRMFVAIADDEDASEG